METEFTPLASFAGGLLIGTAAVLLMLLRGRILGVTGILAGALRPAGAEDAAWRILMLLGMGAGPWVFHLFSGHLPVITVPASLGVLVVGGLCVGVGVTLGSGCTSGHGVCGLARMSPRSVVATLTFMLTIGATVFVMRHVLEG
ncbi:YeeE/YedE thiosulfate transporter family protein [uncultured Roseobacter sp.]|uniref:YeeE/YedE family protein n=1 Tax=uncultured Roseobacter sp. TaxID=114847 RepID=UPI00262B40C6|nr:YeeE/YedE thiosulfate transporter family protein [uncultured Roseobacter sp.]